MIRDWKLRWVGGLAVVGGVCDVSGWEVEVVTKTVTCMEIDGKGQTDAIIDPPSSICTTSAGSSDGE